MNSPGPAWRLPVRMPDGSATSLAFDVAALGLDGSTERLGFERSAEEGHAYVYLEGGRGPGGIPSASAFALEPGVEYELRGQAQATGSASLWLLQFDERERVSTERAAIRDGRFSFSFLGHAAMRWNTIALRIQGSGAVAFSGLSLSERRPAPPAETASTGCRIGIAGGFRVHSVLFDPAGYRPLGERHRGFYEDRDASWYAPVARRLNACRRVLDLGCGPGLLLEALRAAGVEEVTGLERDPVFVATCRAANLPVVEHDLNWPFPFLRSRSFDGAVAHHTLDYVAPVAALGALREAHRVLEPGGLLVIASRSDGRASGDMARTSPLSQDRLERLLHEAGFEDVRLKTTDRGVTASARRGAGSGGFRGRRLLLGGRCIRPWRPPTELLAAPRGAWDALSRRDFAPATTPDKREIGEDQVAQAYYTGYREDPAAGTQRAVCRATSREGQTWMRDPLAPVLETGREAVWDAGGVAAGSVIRLDAAPQRLVMYYSGRALDGTWGGIGMAHSADGVHWCKAPEPVLTAAHFPGLRHLALADVLRTSDGAWLMHCEGARDGGGWEIYQAGSADGVDWAPTGASAVLPASEVPWGAADVANPKCVELETGLLLLGVNTAGADRRFELALATSADGRSWSFLGAGPLICARPADYRIESLVTTASAWRDGTQRAYYFAASTKRTDSSSGILVADADPDAAWAPTDWETARPGLYYERDSRLFARARHDDSSAPLVRHSSIDRELQCTGLADRAARVRLSLAASDVSSQEILDSRAWAAGDDRAPLAWCVRILRADTAKPELARRVWRGAELVDDSQWPLSQLPAELIQAIDVDAEAEIDANADDASIDHVELWAPGPPTVGTGDAHMYMGTCRTGDPLLPDLGPQAFLETLDRNRIAQALVMPYGGARQLDGLDEIRLVAAAAPDRIHPLTRLRALPPEADPLPVDQLELLWQLGAIVGAKVHLSSDGLPSDGALAWLEERQALSLWHVASRQQLDALESSVLKRFSFPVLLSHFGGYPADRARYTAATELLDRYEQLHLVTSCVWFSAYLEAAVCSHPDRVLLGSDFPAIDPRVARAAIEALDLSASQRALVTGENLRFLLERAAWHRDRALAQPERLRFATPPQTVEQERSLGFEVVPVDATSDEPASARRYWGEREVIGWYREDKPWAHLLVDVVRDLQPRSVLEFGCNVGRNLALLHEAFPDLRLVGIDINHDAVRTGRKATGLDLRIGDESALREMDEGEFDLVFTVSVIDHVADPDGVCGALTRCAANHVLCWEVWLPSEGRVVRQPDVRSGEIREATPASYSWHLGHRLRTQPRVWRVDERPLRLHASALGPYYRAYLAFLEDLTTTAC